MEHDVREPTWDEIKERAKVYEDPDGRVGFAVSYPQMGGYVSKAVAVFTNASEGGCFDVAIWHDGEFPFSSDPEATARCRPTPIWLHHCDEEQFVDFGMTLRKLRAIV